MFSAGLDNYDNKKNMFLSFTDTLIGLFSLNVVFLRVKPCLKESLLFFVFFFIICERVSLHDSPLWVLSSVPTAAPRDIAVEVFNTTVLRVSWTPAPSATVRGHLGGYHVSKQWLAGSTTFFRLLKKRRQNKV